MNAIELLVNEHDSILKMIQVTKTMLDSSRNTPLRVDHLEQVVDFIKNFADKYHHLKEEDVLFVEMESHGMSRENGPIAVMLHEHNQGRAYIAKAVEAIELYKTGDQTSLEVIKVNLLNYCDLLTNHINKENTILYPMAERILPKQLVESMSRDFESSIATTQNNEYVEVYLKRVDEFVRLYLND